MQKLILLLLFCCWQNINYAQAALGHEEEIKAFQADLNASYKDKAHSPLSNKDRRKFKGHQFYPIQESYRMEATFIKADSVQSIQMGTSSDKLKTYDVYGRAVFQLEGKSCTLNIYQSHKLREIEEHKNHLFLPFTDMTSGEETYGAGRYIDLTIPDGDTIVIDFNKAYNPYCAYSPNYSCPIPPVENDLEIKVEAGVRLTP
jgi:uncharacterized protein (DUF1684 family)